MEEASYQDTSFWEGKGLFGNPGKPSLNRVCQTRLNASITAPIQYGLGFVTIMYKYIRFIYNIQISSDQTVLSS
jgi:hypothetical protein